MKKLLQYDISEPVFYGNLVYKFKVDGKFSLHDQFVTFPCGILGQVWYLIVSILELCCFSYFKKDHSALVLSIMVQ